MKNFLNGTQVSAVVDVSQKNVVTADVLNFGGGGHTKITP